MHSVEFINFTIDNWDILIAWCITCIILIFLLFKNSAPAEKYDPLHFYLSFNLGTGYGVLISLYQFGFIKNSLMLPLTFFAIVLMVSFYILLKRPVILFKNVYKLFFKPWGNGHIDFYLVLLVYFLFTIIILLNTGLGALADSSRFEQARGFGLFIRVLDLFHLIILAYGTTIILSKDLSWLRKYSIIFGLIIFLIFSSLLGGAKFAFLEGLYVIAVSIYAYGKTIKLSITSTILLMSFATAFALLVLNLNGRNGDTEAGVYNDEGNQLGQRFVARILANGDSYYGSLPYDVIDNLKVDNVFIRFIAPIIGISQTSKIVGYNVEDYSVGRSILLYHDSSNEVSGGPVSHFDLFAYVYFGWFGFIFIIIMVILVTSISNAIKKAPSNIFYISVLAALWVRCLPILLEPTMGFAYVFDAILLIFSIKIASYFIEKLIISSSVKS